MCIFSSSDSPVVSFSLLSESQQHLTVRLSAPSHGRSGNCTQSASIQVAVRATQTKGQYYTVVFFSSQKWVRNKKNKNKNTRRGKIFCGDEARIIFFYLDNESRRFESFFSCRLWNKKKNRPDLRGTCYVTASGGGCSLESFPFPFLMTA